MLDSFLATAQELKVNGLTHSGSKLPVVDQKSSLLGGKVSAGPDDSQEVFISGDSSTIQSEISKEVNVAGSGRLKLYNPEFLVESFGDNGGADDSSMCDMEGNEGKPPSLFSVHPVLLISVQKGWLIWTG